MTTTIEHLEDLPMMMVIDDEHAEAIAYARSPEGREKIETAQTEIDAGFGILADEAYFENLRERRNKILGAQ
jgi:hypothetical protein